MESVASVAIPAIATLFAIIGPLDIAAVFAALAVNQTVKQQRSMAIRGTLIGGAILVSFALVGEIMLTGLGISLAALQAAGGILLLLMGIDMVFARSSGGISATDDEKKEAISKPDISVFPLATPLIAGPGAMGAVILLMAEQTSNTTGKAVVIGSLLVVLLLTLVSLLLAGQLQKLVGVTGMHVITRVMGVILTALAVQFIFEGIAASHLFGS
ncbi:MAG: MarC family protein [Proteobacteria bacterium]|nr:MarC family protein [Pseudomonadota bacterium]